TDLVLHHDFTDEYSASKSGRSLSQPACKCSFITLMSPSTAMKFVSPFQRGTTCQCRWPGTPAPATRPRLRPTLKPSGALACFSACTDRCNSEEISASSLADRSS